MLEIREDVLAEDTSAGEGHLVGSCGSDCQTKASDQKIRELTRGKFHQRHLELAKVNERCRTTREEPL